MPREAGGLAETPAAQLALVGLLLGVDPVVLGQVRAPAEGPAAVTALAGPLAHVLVFPLVANQIHLVVGQPGREGAGGLVVSEMLKKVLVLEERSATLGTFMVGVLMMGSHPATDACTPTARLAAFAAPRGLVAAVSPLVSREVWQEVEGFPAPLTFEGSLPGVDLLMSLGGLLGTTASFTGLPSATSVLLEGRLISHQPGACAHLRSTLLGTPS